MFSSQVYGSELEKMYGRVSLGIEELDETNFDLIYGHLPKKDAMLAGRRVVGELLVEQLELFSGKKIFNDSNFKVFLNTPSSFKCVLPGVDRDLEFVLRRSVDVMGKVNTYFGHWGVAVELIEFLRKRNALIFSDFEQLSKKYGELVEKTKGLQLEVEKYHTLYSPNPPITLPKTKEEQEKAEQNKKDFTKNPEPLQEEEFSEEENTDDEITIVEP